MIAYNVYAYCANNPVMYKDEFGESVTVATTCVIVVSLADILLVAATICIIAGSIELLDDLIDYAQVAFAKKRDKADADPYARPNQKKQGRENKNKNRQHDNYTPRNNRRDGKPAPPKHHTPGKDHQKFSQARKTKNDLLYKKIG